MKLDLAGRVVQVRGEADVARAQCGGDAGVGQPSVGGLVAGVVRGADDDDRRLRPALVGLMKR